MKVYRKGRYGNAADLQVKALRVGPGTRAAIVVSKKVSKRAVVRNRIRRRLSGVLQDLWSTLVPGYDIVVTVRSESLAEAPAPAVRLQLTEALRRAGTINQEEKPRV
jgi:ribonuclease P protein component